MTPQTLPTRIFMATDFSGRCDRALARAAQLAKAWNSELTSAHTVHPGEVALRDRWAAAPPPGAGRTHGR